MKKRFRKVNVGSIEENRGSMEKTRESVEENGV